MVKMTKQNKLSQLVSERISKRLESENCSLVMENYELKKQLKKREDDPEHKAYRFKENIDLSPTLKDMPTATNEKSTENHFEGASKIMDAGNHDKVNAFEISSPITGNLSQATEDKVIISVAESPPQNLKDKVNIKYKTTISPISIMKRLKKADKENQGEVGPQIIFSEVQTFEISSPITGNLTHATEDKVEGKVSGNTFNDSMDAIEILLPVNPPLNLKDKVNIKYKTTISPSSMVNRLKLKERKAHTDSIYETTKVIKVKKLNFPDENEKLPILCFSGTNKKIYSLLSTAEKDFLDNFWMQYGDGSIWSARNEKFVILPDFKDLIKDNEISNLIIDAFADILQRRQDADREVDNDYFIFSSSTFTSVRDNLEEHIQTLLYSRLSVSTKYRYNMFPLIHSQYPGSKIGYHWTLLLLDTCEGIWTLFNPMRVQKGRHDTYLDDAKLMRKVFEDYQHSIIPFFTASSPTELVVDMKCPQQFANSVDCGALVCYYMHEFVAKRPLKEKMPKQEVRKFRAFIASSILNDPGYTCQVDLP